MTYIRVRNTINVIYKKVLDVYFAEKEEETVYETIKGKETKYKAVKGDNLSTIANKNGITLAKLKKDNALTKNDVKLGQSFIIKKGDTKKEKGKKVTFNKLNKAVLGQEIYIVVKTENLDNIEIELNIKQGKEKVFEEKDRAISIQENDKKMIKTIVGEYAKNDKITNKNEFKDWAIAKITLAPKTEATLKSYTKSLKNAKDKKTYLFLAVNACTDIEDQTVFYKDGKIDKTNSPNYYLNGESEWLELGYCECCDFNVDSDGFVNHSKITKEQVTEIEQGSFSDPKKSIKNIILHRTVTSSARKTIDNGFKKKRGNVYYGTHFLVGKNGGIYQCASLKKYTYHVTNYNSKSIGIEVVGEPYDKNNKITKGFPDGNPVHHWDSLPTAQAESVACVVKGLLKYYGLKKSDIKNHEDLQAKAKDEGKTVYDAIINLL